jgi:hypothetical protein
MRVKANYQDFVISSVPSSKRILRRLLGVKLPRTYYGAKVRRYGRGNAEVTFELPARITAQMQTAIQNGKQIRVFVP